MKIRCAAKWKGMTCALAGDVTRTIGTFPNVSTIRIPSSTFVPWNHESVEAGKGDLVLRSWVEGHGEPYDVTVKDLYAHDVQWEDEFVDGALTGRFIATVTLKDRRWLWEFGHVTRICNVPTEDAKGVVAGTARSLKDLIGDCLEALGESRGSITIPEGGDGDPPDGPHVEWTFDDARSELEQLLSYAGYVLVLTCDSRVEIYKADEGGEPEVPEPLRIPRSLATVPTYRPTRVIVTTAPRRIRDEVTVQSWVAVGEETDGTIEPIGNLSYKPAEGWYESAAKGFPGFDGANKARARKCVLKWFRIPDAHKDKLPLLEDRSTVVASVRAKPCVQAEYSYLDPETKKWKNASGEPQINYSIDFRAGIVKFGQVCAHLKEDGVTSVEETEYLAPSVWVRFGYEVRNAQDSEKGYYTYTKGSAGRDQVVRLPSGTLYRVGGDDQNKTELDALAEKVATRILSQPASIEQGAKVVLGHWEIDCNGVIGEVRWRANFTTEYDIGWEPPSLSRYFQKRSLRHALAEAEAARLTRYAEGEHTAIGAGARAHHDAGESTFDPIVAAGPAGPAGFVKYEGA